MFAIGSATLAIVLGNWSGTELGPKQPKATLSGEKWIFEAKKRIEKPMKFFFFATEGWTCWFRLFRCLNVIGRTAV